MPRGDGGGSPSGAGTEGPELGVIEGQEPLPLVLCLCARVGAEGVQPGARLRRG